MTKTKNLVTPVIDRLYDWSIQDKLPADTEALSIVLRMLRLIDSLSPAQLDRIINNNSVLATEYEGKANLIGDGELGDGFRSMSDAYSKIAKLLELVK